MSEQLKVLVCGDVEGKFKKLQQRLDTVIKKSGSFDYLFCVGNFFGNSSEEFAPYKSGKVKLPIPTYILGPNNSEYSKFYPEVNGCELASNIVYLGKRGVFTTDTGVTVAYVSGTENAKQPVDCTITSDDVDRVKNACIKNQSSGYRGIDILLSSEWPAHVTKYDENPVDSPPAGSTLVSKLVLQVKPRYHFFGLAKKHYERPPYKNQNTGLGIHFTRAIALANVANDRKEKWLYALNLTPLNSIRDYELYQLTTDTTECPYMFDEDGKNQQYFYDTNYKGNSEKNRKRKSKNEVFQQRLQKVMNVSQSDCWFCLASPKFEKHLVVSIGEEAYLTLAKGGLVPDHMIILPISHYRMFSDMPTPLQDEIEKYPFQQLKLLSFKFLCIIFIMAFFLNAFYIFKISLTKYFKTKEQIPVFFDRNFKTPHYQMQAVPVPAKKAAQVAALFVDTAEEKGLSLTEMPDSAKLDTITNPESSYFYLEIGKTRLIHTVKKYFPLQFAREVLAHRDILNMPERVEWRNCPTTKEEEIEMLEDFRNNYKPFDFTV